MFYDLSECHASKENLTENLPIEGGKLIDVSNGVLMQSDNFKQHFMGVKRSERGEEHRE